MATVTGNFSVTVAPPIAPPPPPLAITPSTGTLPNETEGVAVPNDQVAVVSGGVPPYAYQFSGLPAGVTAVEIANPDGTFSIQLTGTPAAGDAAGSPYTVGVTVTDSAPATANATAKLEVGK